MNPDEPAFVFEMPPVPLDPVVQPTPGFGSPSLMAPTWRSDREVREAAGRGGIRRRAASIAQRMATLRAWEFENVPMLRRRAPAEVFFAVWALSGREHDAAFTAKAVLAHSRISERAARLALRAMLDDGWIERHGAPNGEADGRLRPYRSSRKLEAILVEYEARFAATF